MFGPSCGLGDLAVGAGIEVGTAAEEQAVEAFEQVVRVVAEAVRGQHDGDPAGLVDGVHVGQPQVQPGRRARPLVTAAPRRQGDAWLREELVRDDADEGWTCVQDWGKYARLWEPLHVFSVTEGSA